MRVEPVVGERPRVTCDEDTEGDENEVSDGRDDPVRDEVLLVRE